MVGRMWVRKGIVSSLLGAGGVVVVFAGRAGADVLLTDKYSTYANGDLVGQNGWTQLLAPTTGPIQVTGGKVVFPALPPGTTTPAADNQDAYKSFSASVAPPATGSMAVFATLGGLNVSAASAIPSYFIAMSDTSSGFANERVTAKDNGDGTYSLGARVTGQAGFPFVYGAPLAYNTTHNVVIEADLVSGGTSNDVIKLFVDPASSDPAVLATTTPYLTETYTSGTGTDPTALGVVILSQFTNATTGQTGFTLSSLDVASGPATPTPEPGAATAALITAGGGLLLRRRRA